MLESNNQKFNHLKIHTQYSICEGAIKIEDLKESIKTSFPNFLKIVKILGAKIN